MKNLPVLPERGISSPPKTKTPVSTQAGLFIKEKHMLTEKNYDQVKSLLSKKKLYVFDMDGTIYLGNNPFDFAIDFIKKLRADGRKILFFTNNASRDPKTYVERLTKLGFAPTDDEICTSGNVTSAFLTRNRKGKKVYLIGTPALYRQFLSDGVDLVCDENGKPDGRDADIVVSSFDTGLTYEKLVVGCDFIRYGAEFLSTHPDLNCPTENGFIPDSGAIAALITASTGVKPVYFGKPYRETVDMISEITGEAKENMIIFGDRLYTDIAVGRRHGITACLVLTGECTTDDVDAAEEKDKPDIMLPSLGVARDMMFG